MEEGEIKDAPMAKMKPPKNSEVPVPVLDDDALKKMLATCERQDANRDDRATRLWSE